ncbi:thioredoxin domain-containing protein [Myxococcota bacterium]|nr:thioredoxin domain-containing protein [Myxococcota bacterium]
MSNGSAIVLAAAILGLSILGGSYLMVQALDAASGQVAELGEAVAGLEIAAAPPKREAPRRRGIDPNKVHEVKTAGSPSIGPDDAAVTLIEFSDFQCPFCARVTPTLEQIQETYGDEVRIVFKHLPLRIHPQAPLAHAASEAAKEQGKFWEMHDLIFANQRQLTEEKFIEYAGQIDLDVEQFKVDMASPEIKKRVDADMEEASQLGVTGTPGFFINGKFVSGARPFADFKQRIDVELDAEG